MGKDAVSKKEKNYKSAESLEKLAEGFLLANTFSWYKPGSDPVERDTFCYTLRSWNGMYFLWNDGRYYEITENDMKSYIARYLQKYNDASGVDFANIPVTDTIVKNVLLNLRAMPDVHIPAHVPLNSILPGPGELKLYDDPGQKKGSYLLAFKNKTVFMAPSLSVVKADDHFPGFFTLSQLPYDYDPRAACPLWEEKVFEIMGGDIKRVQLLAEWFGYCLMPTQKFHKFMIFSGEGSNGKGVITGILEKLVGVENVAHVPLVQFGDKFALSFLLGKMLNTSSESSHRLGSDAEAYLKAYTAGDRMMFERKYKDPISAYPTAKVMLSTNKLPSISDRSDGIWRRALLVPFDLQFEGVKKDVELGDKLAVELPGIFNWALDGMRSLVTNKGFIEPERCKTAIDEYKRESNPARMFLEDHYIFIADEPGEKTADIYSRYKGWCEERSYKPMGDANFGREVKRVFPGTEKKRIRESALRVTRYVGVVEDL